MTEKKIKEDVMIETCGIFAPALGPGLCKGIVASVWRQRLGGLPRAAAPRKPGLTSRQCQEVHLHLHLTDGVQQQLRTRAR